MATATSFGTTESGGAHDDGTVFEIVKTATGYADTPTTLVSFDGADGAEPRGSLIADASGNLFGTTFGGGGQDSGTVFQIVKTPTGYADTPLTLLSFDGNNGWGPEDGLIIDGNGNLFGTTSSGGGHDLGTVFEIVKMPRAGYASTPNTLVSFDSWDEARPSGNGQYPSGSLIATLNGNLFGTTLSGGANHYGTAFRDYRQRIGPVHRQWRHPVAKR